MFKKLVGAEMLRLLFLVFAIYAFHYCLRVWSSSNLGDSDAAQAISLDILRIGYDGGVGPLYTWLLYFSVHLFGYSVSSFLLVKYIVVIFIYLVFYYSYLVFSSDRLHAFLASFSLGSLYFLMWRLHEVMTDRLLTTLITSVCFYLFFSKKKKNSDWLSVVAFGFFIGLGLLTEVYFLIQILAFVFLVAFATSGWTLREITLSVFFGVALSFPFWNWLFLTGEVSQFLLGVKIWQADYSWGWNAIRTAVLHPLYVLSPAVLVLLPLALGRKKIDSADAGVRNLKTLCQYLFICLLIWVFVFGFLAPAKNTEAHTAMSIFLPLLILIFVRLETIGRSVKALFLVLCVFPVVAIFFRVGNLLIEEPFCKNCRWSIPYKELAAEVRNHYVLEGSPWLCSTDVDLVANLKIHLPNLKYSSGLCGDSDAYIQIENESQLDHAQFDSMTCHVSGQSVLMKIQWAQPHWPLNREKRERYSFWRLTSNLKRKINCEN